MHEEVHRNSHVNVQWHNSTTPPSSQAGGSGFRFFDVCVAINSHLNVFVYVECWFINKVRRDFSFWSFYHFRKWVEDGMMLCAHNVHVWGSSRRCKKWQRQKKSQRTAKERRTEEEESRRLRWRNTFDFSRKNLFLSRASNSTVVQCLSWLTHKTPAIACWDFWKWEVSRSGEEKDERRRKKSSRSHCIMLIMMMRRNSYEFE